MPYLGMLVVAGRDFPVTHLALRDGALHIFAAGPGPCPAFANEPVTVFCEDGTGMVQGGYVNTPEVSAGDTARLFVVLQWMKTTDDGPRDLA